MDKLDRNNTITIKINDREKVYREELAKKDHAVNKKQTESIIAEQEVQTSSIETTKENELVDESFEWILPSKEYEEPQSSESSIFTYTGSEKTIKKDRGLQKLFLSIIVAVLVGSGFMYIVLKTITAKEAIPTTAPIGETPGNNTDPSTSGTIAIDPLTVTVVQGGVFSSADAAKMQRDEFFSEGIPAAVLAQKDKYYIVLFASDSLERAKAVSLQYKEKIPDAFWKEFTLEASEKIFSKTDSQKIKAIHSLFNQLTTAATSAMLSTEKIETTKLQASLDNVQSLKSENKKLEEMVSVLSKSVSEMKKDPNSFEESVLVQEQLLQFVVLYASFIQS